MTPTRINTLKIAHPRQNPTKASSGSQFYIVHGKPMTEEEALLQFEILGHDFFVFEDYQEEVNKIIYRRKDNEYGIIVVK